jgi:N-acetylmuramoyl-L-alanine amidase
MKRSAVVVAFLALFAVFPQVVNPEIISERLISLASTLSAAFYADTSTPEFLRRDYAERKINILIVAGHDNEKWGTEYKGIKEADLNLEISKDISKILAADDRFNVKMTREGNGEYSKWFSDYIAKNEKAIIAYKEERKSQFKEAIEGGFVTREVAVDHNNAPIRVARDLYAVNKYTSDNPIDLVLHVHWNDYAGRRSDKSPKYSGFSIYVPEGQLPNARASQAVAASVRARLAEYFAKSNLPGEAKSGAVVPDQDLIAVGANASQDKAAMLIEYGYIYEDQFTDTTTRDMLFAELALQTYWGIVDFFEGSDTSGGNRLGVILPYKWDDSFDNKNRSRDVLALQAALLEEGLYPPKGKTLNDCPLSGAFGKCTKEAVVAFQEKFSENLLEPNGLTKGTGVVDKSTSSLLNRLYGSNAGE